MDYRVSKEKWVTWEEKDRRVYLVREDFLESPDLMDVLEFLDCLDLMEKMEGQVSRAYLESRVTKGFPAAPVFPDRLVSQDWLGPLGLMVFLDSKENSESPDSLASQHRRSARATGENQEGLGFRARRVSPETTDSQASRDSRGPSESRVWTAFLAHPEDPVLKDIPEPLGFLDRKVHLPLTYTLV